MTNYVAYYRVSTEKQGASGLGLQAQEDAVNRFIKPDDAIIASFTEVESGRNPKRPQLAEALNACRKRKATLLIAKLDRLSRSVAFIANLLEDTSASKVPFVAVDNPHANKLTLHILSAVAEEEARAISDRTKAALAAAKARGVKIGGDRGYRPDNTRMKREADKRARAVIPVIRDINASGVKTLNGIADELNSRGVKTSSGKQWSAKQVQRVILRTLPR